jgi:uncharacterized membrane protein YgcG
MIEPHPISHLSQVISQSIAPAFILGAASGFISVLVTRLNRIVDRSRLLSAATIGMEAQVELSRLTARASLINRSLFWAVASALVTIALMIVAFTSAFFDFQHERFVSILFVMALLLFGSSLVNFGREIRIVINDPDNFE